MMPVCDEQRDHLGPLPRHRVHAGSERCRDDRPGADLVAPAAEQALGYPNKSF
jgi:hypothetical protein